MSINQLYVKNFRNLAEQRIELNPQINFFIGDNGSGKSSILESVFFIGHGKSFRTAKSELICHFDQREFFVNVKDESGGNFGVSKNVTDVNFTIRHNGKKVSKLSELAKNFAVQIVTPESFKLFFGGAKERRRFLDLGLFHVEHSFSYTWKVFTKIHKQRNATLKNRLDKQTIDYWTAEFVTASKQIAQLRESYTNKLASELKNWIAILLPELANNIAVSFYQGWSKSRVLQEILSNQFEKEIKQGFCAAGAHKFDLRFLVDDKPLEQKLSRGQQKLFLLALTFAQMKLIEKVTQVKPILLIDDLGAELDVESRTRFNNAIAMLSCQIVVSAIDIEALKPLLIKMENSEKYSMFHVEHGEISEVKEIG